MSTVLAGAFASVVGQAEAVATLSLAVSASHGDEGVPSSAMTHAWLITGPPGSGRSVAARAFAAALECPDRGCGQCVHCRTVRSGTHGDVRSFNPEGLTIGVKEMREVVKLSARRPTTGRWQIVLIEDADRLTEGASNALLKAVEEPSPQTVFLLCAPSTHPDDISVTIRSRCRVVNLVTPSVAAIANVLARRDGIDAEQALWAASVCGGHIGRARRLATDEQAREKRTAVLQIPAELRTIGDVYVAAAKLVDSAKAEAKSASLERDDAEMEALKMALGAGGTGKGAVGAARGTAGVLKDLERKQKLRATRTQRDVVDRALIDLSGFYRDVIALAFARNGPVTLINPDIRADLEIAAGRIKAEGALRRLDAILACRESIERSVKLEIAAEALMMRLLTG
ncbi:DNA polymerase III subunit delta' [Nakamurella antarctica]|uniref:DNA polymerase III subunit delta n=1 Tax=Nakamurella antarctica TaxID=1902245 RepID=A0A3G8ZJY7_9ACTN|nr:DNA polymerase III subunit delta' [Nakamurella antarctica]AZI57165.1 DNA polymerase III subunit delta' [Nakamurella antarctica]